MPPFGADPLPFQAHVAALESFCSQAPSNPGVVVEVSTTDDPAYISPPQVIEPVYQCATIVGVRGAILNATVRLIVNGALSGSFSPARNPDKIEFNVAALRVGDVLTAVQELNGVISTPSPPVIVRDHHVDYPVGLPAPIIDPTLIYECADVIAVRHVPGATVTVFVDGGDPVSFSGSTGWTTIVPGRHPFVVGNAFTAKAALCDEESPLSISAVAVSAPGSLTAPTFDPSSPYANQELVNVGSLVNGTHVSMALSGFGSLGGFSTPISWFPNFDAAKPLGRPLNTGDHLQATQELCGRLASAETPGALGCAELPAPRIEHPIVGSTYVVVVQAVPGTRLHVYDAGGAELGDGSGSVIILRRAITGGDTLTVVQQLGQCTSRTGYRVAVRNSGG